MKKINKLFRFIALVAVTGLLITGCAGLDIYLGSAHGGNHTGNTGNTGNAGNTGNTVTIRTENNVSTVRSGGTLRFGSTGQGTTWKVSSTRDGSGPVAEGTSIDANGLLTVSTGETVSIIYVIVMSPSNNQSAYKQIRVVTVTGVTVSPQKQSVTAGRTSQFKASVAGNNSPDSTVTWNVSSNAAGTGAVTPGTGIDADGLLTVAANETLKTLYVVAASAVDPSKSGSTLVTVVIPSISSVTVSSRNQSVTTGKTLQFNVSVTGTNNPDTAVTWNVSSNAAGTGAVAPGTGIDATGLLTVAADETVKTLFVFATSVVDPAKSGSTAVTVNIVVITPTVTSVTVSPTGQSIRAGNTLQFRASVTGTNNPDAAVTWKVSSNTSGSGAVTPGTSIDANGLLTIAANEAAKTLYVTAASAVNPAKSGRASVAVTAPVVSSTVTGVTVSPSNTTVMTNKTLQFTATVTGTNNQNNTVTWKVSSNAAGTGTVAPGTKISASGLLTVAPNESVTTLYVTATSAADPSKSGSATVTIRNNNENQGQNKGQAHS